MNVRPAVSVPGNLTEAPGPQRAGASSFVSHVPKCRAWICSATTAASRSSSARGMSMISK